MITIITATLNAAKTIERSIASLAGQNVPFQHLVIDGGSADATADICARSSSITFVSAPRSSIYEAWNIGVERAEGEAVMFLNADDELLPDALATVVSALAADADLVAGHADMVSDVAPDMLLQHFVAVPHGDLNVRQLALGVPAINAIAFKKTVFERHGLFPTNFRAAGDRAFLLYLALAEPALKVKNVDATLYRYFSHEGSLTLHRSLRQRLMIANEHFDLASELLARPMNREQRAVTRFWRRREASVGFVRSLGAGKIGQASSFAVRALRAEFGFLTAGRSQKQ